MARQVVSEEITMPTTAPETPLLRVSASPSVSVITADSAEDCLRVRRSYRRPEKRDRGKGRI